MLRFQFCFILNIILFQGYSPLGSPGTDGFTADVLKNPVVTMVADKLGKTPAQVAIRWGLQMGHSVLPKSTNETRIKENFDVMDWSIPDDLLAKFSEIRQASFPVNCDSSLLQKFTFLLFEIYTKFFTTCCSGICLIIF